MTLIARDADLVVVFETHATSLDNEADLASGWYDVALSATGEEQARLLGARHRDDDLAAVYCSDLTRSFRTAEIAFRDRVLPIVRDARLRECDYGAFTRRSALEVEQQRVLHVATPFPNGECYEQVVARVSAWLTEATTTFPGRTVLVIGHRATFYALEHIVRAHSSPRSGDLDVALAAGVDLSERACRSCLALIPHSCR